MFKEYFVFHLKDGVVVEREHVASATSRRQLTSTHLRSSYHIILCSVSCNSTATSKHNVSLFRERQTVKWTGLFTHTHGHGRCSHIETYTISLLPSHLLVSAINYIHFAVPLSLYTYILFFFLYVAVFLLLCICIKEDDNVLLNLAFKSYATWPPHQMCKIHFE